MAPPLLDPATLRWQWATLDELTAPEWYAVMAARSAVFVVEQDCVYQDLDGRDLDAHHLMAWYGDAGPEVAAYLRTFAPGVRCAEASLGRVITTAPARGLGIGHDLLARALGGIDERHGPVPVLIHAQAHLDRFYGRHGFEVVSEPYLEDGIPHLTMRRPAPS